MSAGFAVESRHGAQHRGLGDEVGLQLELKFHHEERWDDGLDGPLLGASVGRDPTKFSALGPVSGHLNSV